MKLFFDFGSGSISRNGRKRNKRSQIRGGFIVNVLVVDVGGTHVKGLATGQKQSREFPSGPKLTPSRMVAGVGKLASDWKYDPTSIGYPGVVMGNRPVADPYNLGQGWAGFDFEAAFTRPVKVIND